MVRGRDLSRSLDANQTRRSYNNDDMAGPQLLHGLRVDHAPAPKKPDTSGLNEGFNRGCPGYQSYSRVNDAGTKPPLSDGRVDRSHLLADNAITSRERPALALLCDPVEINRWSGLVQPAALGLR
jgi:hypothetical protein